MSEPEFDCEAGVPLLHLTVLGKRQTWVPRLAWTAERPMVPGGWWIRQPGFPDHVRQYDRRGIDDWRSDLWPPGCMFAGPIPEPAGPNQLSNAERDEAERLYRDLVADIAAGDTWGLPPEPAEPAKEGGDGDGRAGPDVSRLLAAAKELNRVVKSRFEGLEIVALVPRELRKAVDATDTAIAAHEAAAGVGTSVETCTDIQ